MSKMLPRDADFEVVVSDLFVRFFANPDAGLDEDSLGELRDAMQEMGPEVLLLVETRLKESDHLPTTGIRIEIEVSP